MPGHPGGLGPQAPGHRQTGPAGAAALLHQGVEEGVRGRVAALPGAAQHTRDRGEGHERGQPRPGGQLVQVPDRVDLRPQHRVQVVRADRTEQPVAQHTGGVHDGGQRELLRDLPQRRRQLLPVGHVAGPHGDPRPGGREFRPQLLGTLGAGAAPGEQQQVAGAQRGGVPGHLRAQTARPAGDQHGAGAQRRRRVAGRLGPAAA